MLLATDAQPKTRIWATAQDRVQSAWSEPTVTASPRQGYADCWSETASGSGVFLSEDFLGIHSWLQSYYRYAINNPIRYTDPTGRVAHVDCPEPKRTGNCAADCIASYRWGRCLFHVAHEATLAAEVIETLGGVAIARKCKDESGLTEATEGAAEIGYTTVTADMVSDKLFDQAVMHCIQICASGEKCGTTPSDFFGGCGSPVNKTALPRAFR